MDVRELEGILRDLARERYVPSEKLISKTQSAIRGRRLLHFVTFLSLGMQALGVGVAISVLTSPEVGLAAKASVLIALTAFFGAVAVVVVAARSRVLWFFRRVEQLTG